MANPVSPIQRLRLSRPELEALSESLDKEDTTYCEKRSSLRRAVNRPAVLIQGTPKDIESRHEVYTRNLSRSGASVLHTAFLQSQVKCFMVVVSSDRVPITVQATVVRCVHVAGHIHDVGLRFATELTDQQAIDLCVLPISPDDGKESSQDPLRATIENYRNLARKVHDMLESGASAAEVLPILDQLRQIEPPSKTAA